MISNLKHAFDGCWDTETAYKSDWTPLCPPLNQCLVTALVAQDYLGGEIMQVSMTDGSRHFFNQVSGVNIDFTAGQFSWLKEYPHLATAKRRTRKDLFRSKSVKARYEILRKVVQEWLR